MENLHISKLNCPSKTVIECLHSVKLIFFFSDLELKLQTLNYIEVKVYPYLKNRNGQSSIYILCDQTAKYMSSIEWTRTLFLLNDIFDVIILILQTVLFPTVKQSIWPHVQLYVKCKEICIISCRVNSGFFTLDGVILHQRFTPTFC